VGHCGHFGKQKVSGPLLVFSPWAGLAGTRAQSGDWYGSGTLHSGQVLRGSLPLLSPEKTALAPAGPYQK
jgi:hypothetical protein